MKKIKIIFLGILFSLCFHSCIEAPSDFLEVPMGISEDIVMISILPDPFRWGIIMETGIKMNNLCIL